MYVIFFLKINLIKMEIKSCFSLSSISKCCVTSSSHLINLLLLVHASVPLVSIRLSSSLRIFKSEAMICSIKTMTTFWNPLAIFMKRQSIFKMWMPFGFLLNFMFYTQVRRERPRKQLQTPFWIYLIYPLLIAS